MALMDEDFSRCSNCGETKFEVKEVVVIAKNPPRRSAFPAPGVEPMSVLLPTTEKETLYACISCGKYFD